MTKTEVGKVTVEDNGVMLDFTRTIPHNPQEVWQALTDPESFGTWYNATVEMDAKQGGTFTVHSGPFNWTGPIITWEPEKVFSYEHNHVVCPEMPTGANTVVTWTLTPKDGGTELRFTQTGLPSSEGFAPGTHVVIDRLAARINGEEMPDFGGYYSEVEPLYSVVNA